MSDNKDVEALRKMLEEANLKRSMSSINEERERTHDEDYHYRYGSERTYSDLANAVTQVHSDLQFEMEQNNDPALVLGKGETMQEAEERIEATIAARADVDQRTLILAHMWGPDVIQDALDRQLRYLLKMGEILRESQDVAKFTSPAINHMYQEEYGCLEPLPGREG